VNKALLDVGGTSILQRILDALDPLVDERILLTNDAALGQVPGVRLVFDSSPYAGVLPALASGLAVASADLCVAVACDMPFISRPLFEHMLEVQQVADADVVIARTDSSLRPGLRLEPMHAVYRRVPVLEAIRAALARGEQRMISYFSDVRVHMLDEGEWRAIDRRGTAFFNVNTPDDLAEARRLC
jgi:molybdopterin-guanine dinucleotide biosynthesis protein A